MKIEWHAEMGGYWTVHVAANELIVDSGKRLPYPTAIGTISCGRPSQRAGTVRIKTWTPAATVPRGYKSAANRMMLDAAKNLRSHHRAGSDSERAGLALLRTAKAPTKCC